MEAEIGKREKEIADHRQFIEFQPHTRGQILGLRASITDAGRYRFPDVTHFARRQWRLFG